ncbi:MAG: hypothetical protein V3S64_02560 [bacterium]
MKRGRPVVLLANENFVEALEEIAGAAGVPNLPYVVFPTNIDSLPEEEIVAMGESRLHEMVDKLVSQTEASLAGQKLAG